jgi:hypothetical protein
MSASVLERAQHRVHEAKDRAMDCKNAAEDAVESIKVGHVDRCLEDLARLKQWASSLASLIDHAEGYVRKASPNPGDDGPVTPCTCITAHDRALCIGWCEAVSR